MPLHSVGLRTAIRDPRTPRPKRRRERPSLAFVFARSLALTLILALLMLSALSRVMKAQTPAATTSGATSAANPKPNDNSVGGALKQAADRHGLWGSLGVGRASAGLRCDACARESSRAYGIHGVIGMRLTPRFLVGAESFAWMDVIGGGVDRIARGTYLIARSYVFGASRTFLQGGIGVASFEVNDGDVGFLTKSPSLSMALGYDWRVGGLTLTPAVAAIASSGGRLNSDRTGNAISDNARLGLLRTSLAVSWFR